MPQWIQFSLVSMEPGVPNIFLTSNFNKIVLSIFHNSLLSKLNTVNNKLYFLFVLLFVGEVGRNSPAHALIGNVQRDCPSRTAARFRRQTPVTSKQTRVQGVTARQDCDGILLEWDRLHLPYRYGTLFPMRSSDAKFLPCLFSRRMFKFFRRLVLVLAPRALP